MTRFTLEITEPDRGTRTIDATPGLTIGRHPECGCPIADPNVSGHHAVIVAGDAGELLIEDLGSTNGTRLEGGRRLAKGERAPLRDGMVIQMGATEFVVRGAAEERTPDAPPPTEQVSIQTEVTETAPARTTAPAAPSARDVSPARAATEPEPAPHAIRDGEGRIPEDLPPPGERVPENFWFNRFEIDLSTYSVRHERVQCTDMDDVLGGIARGFKQMERIRGVDDAYDAETPLIMNLGILSGTHFMTGLRTYFVGFSPLKASSNGRPSVMWSAGSGKFGTKLRYLDVDEVVFTKRAVKPVYLHISQGENGPVFRVKNAAHLLGKTVNEKIQHLKSAYPDAHFAVIGPAGENFQAVRFAAVALSTENQLRSGDMKSRFCGRGGFGGVLGSKNLLAIVADTKDGKRPKPTRLKEINQIVARGEGSRRFRDKRKGNGGGGTWANVEALQPVHAMPEYNFVPTGTDVSKPLYREAVENDGRHTVKDEACFACGIACHKNVYDLDEDGKRGRYRAKLDYEPLDLLSANIGIFDIDQACDLVELVDDLGMDSISCGVTLAYAMEYNKRHENDPEGTPLPEYLRYGDFDGARRAVEEIASGRLALLGQGSMRLSVALGETGYAMHCKGVEFPAYLPQTNPGYPWALAGGHMSMRTYLLLLMEREVDLDYWTEAITQRGPQIMRDDILGICKFAGTTNDHMVDALTMLTGLRVEKEDLKAAVMRAYLRGWRMEKAAGFTRDDYVMPKEVHLEYPQIQLPYFNTEEFFINLRERVCDTFDRLLTEAEL